MFAYSPFGTKEYLIRQKQNKYPTGNRADLETFLLSYKIVGRLFCLIDSPMRSKPT